MIERLRAFPEDMAGLYPKPHDHRRYGLGHDLRVDLTIAVAVKFMRLHGWETAADLSCGNGAIALSIADAPTLGDFAHGWPIEGPLEETIDTIEPHDVYVCSETLEHLDNPGEALAKMRGIAKGLVLSTPIECWDDDNPEHLWAWGREDVEWLLSSAGWTPEVHVQFDARVFGETYLYGIWVAK